jgi:hypothetical protein
MKVALSVLKIQAEMYQGKTPMEVKKELYFDLPQLPEDDPNFVLLLNARYNYYLDLGDYENAKKVTARLLSQTAFLKRNRLLLHQQTVTKCIGLQADITLTVWPKRFLVTAIIIRTPLLLVNLTIMPHNRNF